MPAEHKVPAGPPAPVRQDARMEALLKGAFASFNPTFGYSVDEVTVTVKPEQIRQACQLAKTDPRLDFDYLRCLSVVEYKDNYQVVYHLYSTSKRHKTVLKADLPKDNPVVPSVVPVWRGADWHEREGAELFGVTFSEHPHPEKLLLFEDFEGKFPLRKDYPFEDIQDWKGESPKG